MSDATGNVLGFGNNEEDDVVRIGSDSDGEGIEVVEFPENGDGPPIGLQIGVDQERRLPTNRIDLARDVDDGEIGFIQDDDIDDEEDIPAPLPSTVQRLINEGGSGGNRLDSWEVDDIDPGEHLKDEFVFSSLAPYFYDLFAYTYGEDFKFEKFSKFTWWNWLSKTGAIETAAMLLQYLQIVTLVMPTSLIWSFESFPYVAVFTFLRTFKIQYLFLMLPLNPETGHLFNYYLPFLVAALYTLALYTLLFVTFFACTRKLKLIGKLVFPIFHLFTSILPFMYIPCLSALLNTFVCYNIQIHPYEIGPDKCFDRYHVLFPILAIFFIPPLIIFHWMFSWLHHEWRPNTSNWNARPHSRYSLVFIPLLTVMVVLTHFLEWYAIVLLFIDFFLILIFVCLHIYFLQWYSKVINKIICSLLFMILFGNMVSILLTSFKMMLPFVMHSFTIFPGLAFVSSLLIGAIIGTWLTQLRFRVIGLTVNNLTAPRVFQIFYNLQSDEIVVPKGDFEVEMAARTVDVFSISVDKLNSGNDIELLDSPGGSVPGLDDMDDDSENLTFSATINSEEYRNSASRKIIERVMTLFTNSLDFGGAHSPYIALSYSLLHGFVQRDCQRAITVLVQSRADRKILWPDFKIMFYIRLKYFLEIEKIVNEKRKAVMEERRKKILASMESGGRRPSVPPRGDNMGDEIEFTEEEIITVD